MPTSCADLRIIGHILNGFYLIKGTKNIETVYCDFTQQQSDISRSDEDSLLDLSAYALCDNAKFLIICRFPEVDWA